MRQGHAVSAVWGSATIAAIAMTGALAFVGAPRAQAPAGQAIDSALFTHLKWRSIGPSRGGRSIAAAGSSRPLEYYFGATGGGLWKTTDGGTTWSAVSDKHFKSSSVGAVAIAPSNPDIVYAGMGETQLRGNIIQGDGVYRSSDAGKTWTHAGLEKTRAIARLRVHPTKPDVVFAAAFGDPYAQTADRGIYRSQDGGKRWDRVLFRDMKTGGVDLSLDAKDPNVIYAALWEALRTPHSLSSGGPGSGLFKSTDGGNTWTELTRNPGLPKGLVGKIGVSVSGADSQRVYAIIEAEDGGVFASDDAGATWRRVNDDRRLRQRAFYYTRINADPKSKDTVYVLNVNFFRSTDGGKTYKTIRVPHGDNHDLWIAPDDPKRMIEANDGGANVSFNGGESWTDQDVPTAQFYNAFVTSDIPYHVCGAQQDNTTACVASAGPASSLYPVGGCESGYIAQSPKDADIFFAGCYGGSLSRFDRRTRTMRLVNVWPENPMGQSASDLKERFQWTFPIVFSPHDPSVLYASSQHLWRSTDDGASWQRISPDLTRADPATLGPSGGPITKDQTGVETYATIFTVAPARTVRGLIWVGSDDGVVHVTRDEGKRWEKVTPAGLPAFARISLIEASPHRAGTAYLAANRYQRADRAPYVYRTDDYGKHWTKIVSGLPNDDFPRVIREDPWRPELLYLGTEHGVYVSFDNGGSWQSLRLNLPVAPVHGLVVTEHDLVIGTHGRSFHLLDDIDTLRELAPDVTKQTLRVFKPGDATRRVDQTATIDYYLQKPAKQVTVEILDGDGAVVRRFTSPKAKEKGSAEAEAKTSTEEEDEDEPRSGPPRTRVTTAAGMNRVTWDLRHEGPRGFKGLIMWAARLQGPFALPGIYQVRVRADGESRTSPLRVRKDPRTDVADADLAAQFALARQVRDRVTHANEAVVRMRSLRSQIDDRAKKANDPQIAARGEKLTAALSAIENEIYQSRLQSRQDPLNYPIKLNNKLAALQSVIESGDGRPTAQSEAVFRDLSQRLDVELKRLDALVAEDVSAFNAALRQRGIAEVATGVPAAEETETSQ
jgi:photosystem II stability/assembly factor-like uncharacterized protein